MAAEGALWKHKEAGIFQEHRATDISIQALSRLRQVLPRPTKGPRAVGCAPSGDPYILPSLAVATMGGMITSTFLTLFLVPVVYAYMDRVGERLRGKREKHGRTEEVAQM